MTATYAFGDVTIEMVPHIDLAATLAATHAPDLIPFLVEDDSLLDASGSMELLPVLDWALLERDGKFDDDEATDETPLDTRLFLPQMELWAGHVSAFGAFYVFWVDAAGEAHTVSVFSLSTTNQPIKCLTLPSFGVDAMPWAADRYAIPPDALERGTIGYQGSVNVTVPGASNRVLVTAGVCPDASELEWFGPYSGHVHWLALNLDGPRPRSPCS